MVRLDNDRAQAQILVFTLWLTGLHGVGKSTLAELVKKKKKR